MRHRTRALAPLAAVLVAALAAGPPRAAAQSGDAPPLSIAELLVDVARDHALMHREKAGPADVAHVRALLQAAVRVDPTLADAHAWLYELASLSGDPNERGAALDALYRADPENEGVFALWLDAGAAAQQSVEHRATWLEQALAARRPAPMQAMVHVALARLALEQMDLAQARKRVAEALALEPGSVDAARLAFDALDDKTPAEDRLAAVLRLVMLTPTNLAAVWRAASILDQYGFTADAGRLFDYAAAMHPRIRPRETPPSRFLMDYAMNLAARGEQDDAVKRCRQAIAVDPATASEALMCLYEILLNRSVSAAEAVQGDLDFRFRSLLEDPEKAPLADLAQAAWMYATFDQRPALALRLADFLIGKSPNDPFIQRIAGWALAINGRQAEARAILEPLATRDPYAAVVLARTELEANEPESAKAVLERLDPIPRSGNVGRLIAQLQVQLGVGIGPQTEVLTDQPVLPPPEVLYPRMAAVLASFEPRCLQFVQDPAKFLQPSIEMIDRNPAPGEPWRANIELRNRGPFPIALGADALVNPVFVLSFKVDADRAHEFPGMLTISVDRARVLDPGESVRVRRTLSVGPAWRLARQMPQQPLRITVTSLLDAAASPEGAWGPTATGQLVRPLTYFLRTPQAVDRPALTALAAALRAQASGPRHRAIQTAAQLLGERQRADLKRAAVDPGPTPSAALSAALRAALASAEWEDRAWALEALQTAGLDEQMLDAARANLRHSEWVVRLMAVRLMSRLGESARELLSGVARNDADASVRAVAQACVDALPPAAAN